MTKGRAIYRRRKPVFGRMKRDFGVCRTHLRGQQAVENDIGLVLMAMNLTKLWKLKVPNGTHLHQKGKTRTMILLFQKSLSVFSYLRPE